MKYAFIAEHRAQFSVQRMCRVLNVTRSGFYAWLGRGASARAQANQALLERIRAVHQDSQSTYGSPRIWIELQRSGVSCGHNRVARLMRQAGIVGVQRGKLHPTTTQRASGAVAAPNLLNQDFSASAPNQKWVSDFTYIQTAQGWLYLAAVLDLFSRKVVGWAMCEHMETDLVQAAWAMALANRHPPPGLLHHSDQGRQYTALAYQQALTRRKSRISMSRVGNCYDNAVMESFFATLKSECVTAPFASRAQARTSIFAFIEIWYNRQRLHSTLGYYSPVDFERLSGH